MIETAIFLIFALLALGSALVVVLHRNPVYSTMSLVVTLVSLAVLFVLLGAPFIAALQILIYTGAIVVLFLFVVMLLNVGREEIGPQRGLVQKVLAAVGAVVLLGVLAAASWGLYGDAAQVPLTEDHVALEVLAAELFADYLLTFELVGLLLLVAVIAATVLAARPRSGEKVMPEVEAGAGPEAGPGPVVRGPEAVLPPEGVR
jgi:NADH-quinone oxidoreductase subunit J